MRRPIRPEELQFHIEKEYLLLNLFIPFKNFRKIQTYRKVMNDKKCMKISSKLEPQI